MMAKTKEKTGNDRTTPFLGLLCLITLILGIVFLLWMTRPADESFLRALAVCVSDSYDAAHAGQSDKDCVAIEKKMLRFRYKRFEQKSVQKMCEMFAQGVKDRQRAVKYAGRNETTWRKGLLRQAKAVQTLWNAQLLTIEDPVYLHYALQIVEGNLSDYLGKSYPDPAIQVGVVNSSGFSLSDVELSIIFTYGNQSETVSLSKALWRAGELWNIDFTFPPAAYNSDEQTHISLDLQCGGYQPGTIAESPAP